MRRYLSRASQVLIAAALELFALLVLGLALGVLATAFDSLGRSVLPVQASWFAMLAPACLVMIMRPARVFESIRTRVVKATFGSSAPLDGYRVILSACVGVGAALVAYAVLPPARGNLLQVPILGLLVGLPSGLLLWRTFQRGATPPTHGPRDPRCPANSGAVALPVDARPVVLRTRVAA